MQTLFSQCFPTLDRSYSALSTQKTLLCQASKMDFASGIRCWKPGWQVYLQGSSRGGGCALSVLVVCQRQVRGAVLFRNDGILPTCQAFVTSERALVLRGFLALFLAGRLVGTAPMVVILLEGTFSGPRGARRHFQHAKFRHLRRKCTLAVRQICRESCPNCHVM